MNSPQRNCISFLLPRNLTFDRLLWLQYSQGLFNKSMESVEFEDNLSHLIIIIAKRLTYQP